MDVNVSSVWGYNITGHGVTVCIVDDGVEWEHKDLKDNYNPLGSWDLQADDPNPSPSPKSSKYPENVTYKDAESNTLFLVMVLKFF